MVRKTVAALVKCAANDIFVCKTDYHIPYIDVVVSIRQAYIRNLLGLKDPAKKKLIGLNIECFIADSVTVFLCRTKGKPLYKKKHLIICISVLDFDPCVHGLT